MFKIDLKSKKSIYEQIIDGFKDEIIGGERLADEKLPSVRELASQLTVNPNTIQKAYAELEKQGFIYSAAGRGNFVCAQERTVDPRQAEAIYERIGDLMKELKYLGVSERDIRYKVMAMTGGNECCSSLSPCESSSGMNGKTKQAGTCEAGRENNNTVQGSFEGSESK